MSSFSSPSMSQLWTFATGLLGQIPLANNGPATGSSAVSASSSLVPLGSSISCPVDSPLSCHNSTAAPESCCFIYPGGLLLQTQFWDARPAVGPVDSWTLHGLWPDLCDGSYDSYCHAAPQYHNITDILTDAGQGDLLKYMDAYWLPNSGTNEHFWQHEWNKHGTCINTLSQGCYGEDYTPGIEVVDFFTRTVEVFKSLDTYAALEKAGIVPDAHKTYTYQAIIDALSEVTGALAYIDCAGRNLNQVWYYYNVRGSLQTGEFVPIKAPHVRTRCPRRGIKYLPKA